MGTTLKNCFFGPNKIFLKYQENLKYLQKKSPSRLKSGTDSHVSGVHFGHVRVLRERRTSIISCGRVVNIDFNLMYRYFRSSCTVTLKF